MELASSVQKMLIPENLPQSEFFELAAVYKPHLTVGGDYFDFIQYDDKRLAFCIADISGKGVSAAILMANFQAILQSLIYQYRDLETFVFALNQAVYRITKSDRFITLFIGELNLHTRKLQYINAGHFPPFLVQNGMITRLDKGCTVIGAFETLPEIQMGEVKLSAPGTLFACTDGLTDIVNELDQYFDDAYLTATLKDADQYTSAAILNDSLMNEVDLFRGSRPYPDDIAILTCKYKV
jgi:sigma-B regulation protein RsbU (phosphoserine phosphatase)